MQTAIVIATLAAIAIANGVAGYIIAKPRAAGFDGFLCGFFLGPVGVLAAFRLDERFPCFMCMEKSNAGAIVCPHCRKRLRND